MDHQSNVKDVGMTQEREGSILEAAILTFGECAQIIKAQEELSELQVELARWLNNIGEKENAREKIRGELADAFVMLNQLELIFGDVTDIEISKLERLEQMVNSDV